MLYMVMPNQNQLKNEYGGPVIKRNFFLNIIILLSITFTGYVHSAEVFDYTIKQLFDPCLEGDSDSRWGEPFRTKCEQCSPSAGPPGGLPNGRRC